MDVSAKKKKFWTLQKKKKKGSLEVIDLVEELHKGGKGILPR